jgi:hypothetical protein
VANLQILKDIEQWKSPEANGKGVFRGMYHVAAWEKGDNVKNRKKKKGTDNRQFA